MKPTVLDKLLLLLMAICLMAFGLLSVALAVRIVLPQRIVAVMDLLEGSFLYSLLFGVAGVLLFALAMWALLRCFAGKGGAGEPRSVIIRQGEGGTLQLSVAAIAAMVQQYCKEDERIKECQVEVIPGAFGAALRLHLSLDGAASIPETSLALQDGLKAHLAQSCGLNVSGVDIWVVPPGVVTE